jgi:hypothetical protein
MISPALISRDTTTSGASRITALIILMASVAVYLVRVWVFRGDLFDDAYITFRFARNLAEGSGLVWNPGGEHVEGFTSLLHVLLLSGAMHLGLSATTADLILLTGAVLGTFTILLWLLRRVWRQAWLLGLVLVSLWIADPNTSSLTTAGLETQLFVLCLAGSYAAAVSFLNKPADSKAYLIATGVFLSIVCRPDGVIYGAALYGALLVHFYTLPKWERPAALGIVRSALVLAGAGTIYAGLVYSYFGYLLPNPFYVKSNKVSLNGAGYVSRYVRHIVLWLGPVILAMIVLAPRLWRKLQYRIILITLAPAVLALSYYLTITHEVGGFHRFSYPTYIYFVMGACAISAAALKAAGPARSKLLLVAPVVVAIIMLGDSIAVPGHASTEETFNDVHFRIGKALQNTGLGERASILCDAAGIIPYLSRFRQIDRVGLTDNYLSGRTPINAEQREEYIWQQMPDVYIGYELPSPTGAQDIAADRQAYPRYVSRLITHKRVTIEDRTFASTPELLHRRMAKLRDEWICLGGVNWPGWSLWGLKCMVYVRRNSPYSDVLVKDLQPLVDQTWGSEMLAADLQGERQ